MEIVYEFIKPDDLNIITCKQLGFTAIFDDISNDGCIIVEYVNNNIYVAYYDQIYCFDTVGNLVTKIVEDDIVCDYLTVISNFVVIVDHCNNYIIVYDEHLNKITKLEIKIDIVINFDNKNICAHSGQIFEITLNSVGGIILTPFNDPRFVLFEDNGHSFIEYLGRLVFYDNDGEYPNRLGEQWCCVNYFTDKYIYASVECDFIRQSIKHPEDIEILISYNDNYTSFAIVKTPLHGLRFSD
jgi:WD40 repeat protein